MSNFKAFFLFDGVRGVFSMNKILYYQVITGLKSRSYHFKLFKGWGDSRYILAPQDFT